MTICSSASGGKPCHFHQVPQTKPRFRFHDLDSSRNEQAIIAVQGGHVSNLSECHQVEEGFHVDRAAPVARVPQVLPDRTEEIESYPYPGQPFEGE